jgi:hypothetical protein
MDPGFLNCFGVLARCGNYALMSSSVALRTSLLYRVPAPLIGDGNTMAHSHWEEMPLSMGSAAADFRAKVAS